MRRNFFAAGLLLLAPLSALAQPAVSPSGPTACPSEAHDGALAADHADGSRLHVEADYLFWFLKPNRIATPILATVIDPTEDLAATLEAGGLADPNARVLFGGRNRDRGPYSGLAARVSWDLDDDGTAAELGGLWLPLQGNHYRIASNANGQPPLTLPFFVPEGVEGVPAGETAGTFAGLFNGAPLTGQVDIHTATQLWGGDVNLAVGLYRGDGWRLQGLGGFRYLGLNDLLQIDAAVTNSTGGSTFDRFYTENNFYGGQLGVRLVGDFGRLRPSLTSKVALGATIETLDITGNAVLPSNAVPPAGTAQLPGGFYTASSNIGRSTHSEFAVVSETNFSVSANVSERVSFTLGYSFLYWSNILRSGDQITRVINPNLNPAFSTFGTPGQGPAQPARLNKETDFWAHGLNAGIEIRF
jgi:hypothetical protein